MKWKSIFRFFNQICVALLFKDSTESAPENQHGEEAVAFYYLLWWLLKACWLIASQCGMQVTLLQTKKCSREWLEQQEKSLAAYCPLWKTSPHPHSPANIFWNCCPRVGTTGWPRHTQPCSETTFHNSNFHAKFKKTLTFVIAAVNHHVLYYLVPDLFII